MLGYVQKKRDRRQKNKNVRARKGTFGTRRDPEIASPEEMPVRCRWRGLLRWVSRWEGVFSCVSGIQRWIGAMARCEARPEETRGSIVMNETERTRTVSRRAWKADPVLA